MIFEIFMLVCYIWRYFYWFLGSLRCDLGGLRMCLGLKWHQGGMCGYVGFFIGFEIWLTCGPVDKEWLIWCLWIYVCKIGWGTKWCKSCLSFWNLGCNRSHSMSKVSVRVCKM